MSVIAHLRVPAEAFELGRILEMDTDTVVQLESMVQLGERAVSLFSVHAAGSDTFEDRVRDNPSVETLRRVSAHDDTVVYALDWLVGRDVFFQGILEARAHVLSATGSATKWEFELRFPDHRALSEFQEYCTNGHIALEVGRIYNPTRPDSGPWYGLTEPQVDTLLKAVEGGYYAIPRGISTQDLAEEFDISDQAVTERLRRAIATLVENTLIAGRQEDVFESSP